MEYDYIVIIGYFSLMLMVSILFKKMATSSSSDYFRGGGKMLWWMVGASAFMTQFSAWTFTGAAGAAFNNGFMILGVFIGNAFAYIFAYLYFARMFRQMRVDTPTEAIRRRFGSTNEQFFTWMIIPLSIIGGGVWLNGLSVFASAAFETNVVFTIWVTGLAVLLVSLLSGAWGVVASDFVQTLVVAVISVACALVALVHVGGPSKIITEFPSDFFIGPDMNYPILIVCFFIFFLVKQLTTMNNMQDSYRYLTAKDSRNASKGALMAGIMMLVGSIIWFIPPWVTAVLYPGAASEFPALGAKASDAVYLVFAREFMPVGTVGILMAGLFAATMSSMDSALNRNSGIFVRSFYSTIIRKNKASESENLRVGQVVCVVNGLLVIVAAQFFSSLKEISLFDLMMQVATLLQAPILIPLFFGMIIRKTPKWAPWVTVLVGGYVSWLVINVFTSQVVAGWFGVVDLTGREASEIRTLTAIAAHLVFTAGFFWGTTLFYKEENDVNKKARENFFLDVETECVEEEGQDIIDRLQREKLGSIILCMGVGLGLMVLIPNPMWGRVLFLLCSLTILSVGYFFKRSARLGGDSRHFVSEVKI